jgi:RNA polymerase sigma factor (sigma-70 family)
LFQLNVGRIYALSLRLTSDIPASEELTKKVFLEAWEKITSMQEDITFSSWISSLTINRFIQLSNDKSDEKSSKNKKKELKKHATDNKLDEEIYNLPENERVVFIIREVEKYSAEQTADLFALPVEQIDQYLNDALTKLNEKTEINIGSLPKKIEPEKDLWSEVFNKINEIKILRKEEEISSIEVEEETEEEKEERRKQRDELRRKEKELKQEELKARLSGFSKKPQMKILAAITFLIVAAAIYFIVTGTSSWEVLSSSGSPKINAESFSGVELLNPGEILTTGLAVNAAIKVPEIGSVEVGPNTNLKRTSEFSVQIETGSISVLKQNANKFLKIEIPSAEIIEYYLVGDYNLSLDAGGNSEVKVNEGWLLLKDNDSEAFVIRNHICRIQKGKGLGIPYHKASSETFKFALDDFIFKGKNDELLTVILSQAEPKNALSLWHLLKNVGENERSQIFNTLYGLASPPDGVTQEGILDLKEDMMLKWLSVIEWVE